MSRKRRNGYSRAYAPKKKSISPVLIVIGLLIFGVVLAIVLFSNRSGESAGNSGATAQVTGAPRVSVVQDTIDLGTIKFDTTVQSVFKVRNVGDRNLMVLGEPRVELVEGC
jgi:flagellar basal body-associated protein FliL